MKYKEVGNMAVANEVFNAYGIECAPIPFGNGHINDTYVSGDYVIQRINTAVFKDPEKLMSNIMQVTDYLKNDFNNSGKDPERSTLTVVKTLDNKAYYKASDSSVWRVVKLIKNTVSYDKITPELLFNAAYGFGDFQKRLSAFDSSKLFETIPDFHNTPKRYKALLEAIEKDPLSRVKDITPELEYLDSVKEELSLVTDALENKKLPTRVTHNDTKINNVLMDKESGDFVAVIDLDTIMPGSLLYDYGDALRSAANTASEDERDLSLVGINEENVRAFTKGFLSSMGESVSSYELELFPFSIRLMALELSIRFFTDYILGDTYFKTHREGQNLDRARCQLRLAMCVEENMESLKKIVADCLQ